MSRRVLFVSHQASRSGAPLLLLHFLRWVRANTDLDVAVLLNEDGELTSEFAAVAPVISLQGDPPGSSELMRVVRRIGWADDALRPLPAQVPRAERAIRAPARRFVTRLLKQRVARLGGHDLIYLNSTYASRALPLLPQDVPVMTHSHELGPTLRELRTTSPWAVDEMLRRTDRYVAASRATAQALRADFNVDPGAIAVCHEFIPIPDPLVTDEAVTSARRELGLSPETFLVGAVGTIGWRKGTDIFCLVAARTLELLAGKRDVRFLWLGDAPQYDSWSLPQVLHDVDSLGLGDRVRFIGSRKQPLPVMALMDVLLLPSRSDPYPLVSLEGAALGKPIVCFEAGGMGEFLEADERLVVPYLDIDAMANRVAELAVSDAERLELGARLSERVRERHRLEVAAPRLLEQIEHGFRDGGRRRT